MYVITIWCGGVEWNEMVPDKIMNRVMKLRFPCQVECTVHRSEENPCGVGLLWCGVGSIDSTMWHKATSSLSYLGRKSCVRAFIAFLPWTFFWPVDCTIHVNFQLIPNCALQPIFAAKSESVAPCQERILKKEAGGPSKYQCFLYSRHSRRPKRVASFSHSTTYAAAKATTSLCWQYTSVN